MVSARNLRRRIKSVKNTAQITKAMQMVASSKMRKAQLAALAGRPYAVLMNRMILSASKDSQDFVHPLMEKREVRKRGVLAVSTDKGLCGALNSNLLREAGKLDKDTIEGFKMILDGELDQVAEGDFYMKGSIDEVLATTKK